MPGRTGAVKRRSSKRPASRSSKKAPPSPPPARLEGPLELRTETLLAIQRHRAEIEHLEADKKATPRARQFAATALNTALRLLAKIDGTGDVTVSQILRSPAWRRCSKAMLDTLRRFPGAAEAVGKTMRELEAQGG
jgi:hypothetical protein